MLRRLYERSITLLPRLWTSHNHSHIIIKHNNSKHNNKHNKNSSNSNRNSLEASA